MRLRQFRYIQNRRLHLPSLNDHVKEQNAGERGHPARRCLRGCPLSGERGLYGQPHRAVKPFCRLSDSAALIESSEQHI